MEKLCKNCCSPLLLKKTKYSASRLKKPYYYTAYYFCQNCQKLYHSDEFKVVNNSQTLPLYSPSEQSESTKDSGQARMTGSRQARTINYDAEIWTDGACVFNGRVNAKASWAFVSGSTERAGLIEGKQTNNVAEALAIYHALIWAAEQGYKNIKIYSDSQITINNMKKPVSMIVQNREIFEKISAVIQINTLQVHFEKVLGHSGDINNERADKLANNLAAQR